MEEASALDLLGWSAYSAGLLVAVCAVAEEVVGDFQVEDVVGVLVVALEVGVLSTLVAVKAFPSVWLEEVDRVVLVVVITPVASGVVVSVVVALGVVVLVVEALGVVLAVVVWVVALEVRVVLVEVVLVEVVLGVVLGLFAPLVAYRKSPSTRAFCNPLMWRLTLRSKK